MQNYDYIFRLMINAKKNIKYKGSVEICKNKKYTIFQEIQAVIK